MTDDGFKRRYEHAVKLYEEGKFLEAQAVLDQLAPDHPDSRHVAYYRASCALALGDLKEARAICERMSAHHGAAAVQYVMRIEEKIKQREKDLREMREHDHERNGRVHEQHVVPTSSNSIPFVVAGGCIALIILVIVLARLTTQGSSQPSFAVRAIPAEKPFVAFGDKYLELTFFYPSASEQGFHSLVVLAPAGESGPADLEKGDRIAVPIATNWPDIKLKAEKALTLSGGSSETIGDTPRDQMMRTVIIPRSGLILDGVYAGTPLVNFNPGPVTTLAAVTAASGPPEHDEEWPGVPAAIGMAGKTHWWGRVGLASDSSDVITHILVRAYPTPNETSESPPPA